ncbi:MAG TPA: hypothetical protein PLC89_18170 [Haliscomenobacter sp.]|uniref:hypothetical protein n=1 Tax=Haliscomenobacter sp. TaxID=2717303 RepID=UPI002BB2D156|nr:hypothetical protein [Haliscomenobacter sp.]HOY19240.1 hypothetical protein [Haliscomenobacter sp.]HPH18745.1 hypothetical protein [Haliscomenobacter sp.]
MKSLLVLSFSLMTIICFGQKNKPTGVITNPVLKQVRMPDLIVTNFVQTGASFNSPNGTVQVPVTVTVKNVGQAPAAIFKVGIDYQHPNGQIYPVMFTVSGQSNAYYPFTNSPLAAGAVLTYQGVLVFSANLRGNTLSAKAIADSCSGDEFMESYCRVKESSETNNSSTAINIVLR